MVGDDAAEDVFAGKMVISSVAEGSHQTKLPYNIASTPNYASILLASGGLPPMHKVILL